MLIYAKMCDLYGIKNTLIIPCNTLCVNVFQLFLYLDDSEQIFNFQTLIFLTLICAVILGKSAELCFMSPYSCRSCINEFCCCKAMFVSFSLLSPEEHQSIKNYLKLKHDCV